MLFSTLNMKRFSDSNSYTLCSVLDYVIAISTLFTSNKKFFGRIKTGQKFAASEETLKYVNF